MNASAFRTPGQPHWWETRLLIGIATLLSAVPLLWPSLPPLVDVPGHMGRYAVQLGLAGPSAGQWYAFDWALVGNLGVDLLVQLLAPLLGLEFSVKLIVMAIPALQVLGFLLAAREVHGRVPPTALFAAPLAYSYPVQFGFINFALSTALAFLALALWVRLGRQNRIGLRAMLFVPISMIIWMAHTFGFGLLGLLAYGAEVARLTNRGMRWWQIPFAAALHCLVLVTPFIPMLAGRAETGGLKAHGWFQWQLKEAWIRMMLRDRWEMFDKLSALALTLPFALALWWKGVRWSGGFLISALLCFALYPLLPRILFGSAYADMRLFPLAVATALLMIGPANRIPPRLAGAIALLALSFFLVRTAGTTVSLGISAKAHNDRLKALEHIPIGARLYSMVGKSCTPGWAKHRNDHLPSMALVRRQAFANDQWDIAGSQLIRVRLLGNSGWTSDPSQLVTATRCRPDWRSLGEAINGFPRHAFDYLWIIGVPPGARYDPAGLIPIWRNGADVVYRIDHRRESRTP